MKTLTTRRRAHAASQSAGRSEWEVNGFTERVFPCAFQLRLIISSASDAERPPVLARGLSTPLRPPTGAKGGCCQETQAPSAGERDDDPQGRGEGRGDSRKGRVASLLCPEPALGTKQKTHSVCPPRCSLRSQGWGASAWRPAGARQACEGRVRLRSPARGGRRGVWRCRGGDPQRLGLPPAFPDSLPWKRGPRTLTSRPRAPRP